MSRMPSCCEWPAKISTKDLVLKSSILQEGEHKIRPSDAQSFRDRGESCVRPLYLQNSNSAEDRTKPVFYF